MALRGNAPFVTARARPRSVGLAWAALGVLSVAFRAPALLNAWQTNSDAAVVGLQAMHARAGEASWFLWGSGYQTSVDATWAALVFAVLGPTPLALMLSSLVLHVALTALAFATLDRRLGRRHPWAALLLVLPLVLTGSPSQTYILYPPRQASLTLAVLALCLLDRQEGARRPWAWALLGGAGASLACFADPYALVLAPVVAVFALLTSLALGGLRARMGSLAAAAVGAALGLVPLVHLWSLPGASRGQVTLDVGHVARNAQLLVDPCLPWLLGARVWAARHMMDYAPWDPPAAVRVVQWTGAAVFLALLVLGGIVALRRGVRDGVGRLGMAGSLALPVTLGGFLLSVMVMDAFSARYLAAIVLVAPFALAPLVPRFGARAVAIALAPFLVASALNGWVGYRPFVRGAWPVVLPSGDTSDEAALARALEARGVRYAAADYWAAYRVTFVLRERLVIVPTHPREDRYAPYRAAFDAAARVAYVFDPLRSREREDAALDEARAALGPTAAPLERLRVGRFTVLVGDRLRPAPPPLTTL